MELAIKVTGLGWKEYWASGWNKLDFFLVTLSVVDIAFAYLESSVLRIVKVLKAQKLLRLLRMTRMAKALKTMKSMLHLLSAIRDSLGAILQVVALILVIFFMFAYMGVLLFGTVKRGCDFEQRQRIEACSEPGSSTSQSDPIYFCSIALGLIPPMREPNTSTAPAISACTVCLCGSPWWPC
jgi:Ion transport protein